MIYEKLEQNEKMHKAILNRLSNNSGPDRWMTPKEFEAATTKAPTTFENMRRDDRYKHLFSDFSKKGAKIRRWKINYTQYLITENSIAA
jgi:hypothetical protein